MAEEVEILKLQVMMELYEREEKERKVSVIAQSLDIPSYKVSRILSALEEQGLADKSISRHPVLTQEGLERAADYRRKIDISVNHLLYEGVAEEYAQKDALHWALDTTDETMRMLEEANERYRIKNELRGEESFSGNILCKLMRDGDYAFSYVFYRVGTQKGGVYSMANHGFYNPCTLSVRKGNGTIKLRTRQMTAESGLDGHIMPGHVSEVLYYDGKKYCKAGHKNDVFAFPVNAMQFVNCGMGVGQFLNGTLKMKMKCSVGPLHMPESVTLFTLTI